jgi:hypothetical protein
LNSAKFKRARVLVSEPYEQYDADIADLSSLAGENDKYRYIRDPPLKTMKFI